MDLSRVWGIVRLLGFSVFFMMLMPLVAVAADTGEADFAKGWDLLKHKKYKEARAALETGMKMNPSNALAQFYLADACRGLKDWSCAEEHYETSLELDAKSSVSELAKQRLNKAKTWRLLTEAKTTLEKNSGKQNKIQKARESLAIAKRLGLDDEQLALHDELDAQIDEIDEKNREVAILASAHQIFHQLEGTWKYVGGKAAYRSSIDANGEFEMVLERLNRDMEDFGVRPGLKAFSGFKIIPFREVPIDSINLELSENYLYAKGHVIPFAIFEKGKGCPWTLGMVPVEAIMAYDKGVDKIRVIEMQRNARSDRCDIHVIDLRTGRNAIGHDHTSEMIRVQK
ncbi:MAG: tetratricopeptide repeat protein [Nitrospirota bacterium]